MSFSQISYQIELLFPLTKKSDGDQDSVKNPQFIVLCKLNCDPCISVGEEISIPKWSLGYKEGCMYKEKDYSFNAKVVGIQRDLYPPSGSTKGTLLVSYFVESNDRDLVIEMCEIIKNNNLENFIYGSFQ